MSHIIKKLTVTSNSLKLEFSNDSKDPFVHVVEISGQRDEALQSHIDAIAERVIGDKMETYEEDKKQITMFDDPTEEEDPTNFADPQGEADEVDYSGIVVPLCDGTQIPKFGNMEIDHAVWFIKNHYTGEDGEAGLQDLIQDFKYSLDIDLKETDLDKAKAYAIFCIKP